MASDVRAWEKLLVLQWKSAVALRGSFFAHVIGMMINNLGITVVWVVFISLFGTVNGWGAVDVIGAQGIGAMTYGLAYGLCLGAVMLPSDVREGYFDGYFLRPLRLLTLVWRSHFDVATIGDALFGVIMVIVACVLSGGGIGVFALAMLLVIPGAAIMVAISTIINSYSLWNPDDRHLSDMVFRVFMTPTLFPAGALPHAMRVLFTFVIPSLLVAAVPWEAARAHAPLVVLAVWLAAGFWLAVAALVFRTGLRHYESGGGVG